MHPALERTWDKADVEAALREALDVVKQLDPPDDLRQLTFQQSMALCTQTAQRVQVPLGFSNLPELR